MGSFRVVSEGPLTRPLAGTVHVGGAKNSALKLMAAALLAPGRSVIHNVPEHPRRRGDGAAAAPARLHGRDRLPRRRRPDARVDRRAARRSTCRRSSTTRRPTSWYAACARRSPCWARSWRAAPRRAWPCPAATRSARAGWTCTSAGCRSSAPSVRIEHGQVVAEVPQRPARRQPVAGLPVGRGDREPR